MVSRTLSAIFNAIMLSLLSRCLNQEDPPKLKSPEDADLSEPKSKTHTAGSPEALSLNIKAPLL